MKAQLQRRRTLTLTLTLFLSVWLCSPALAAQNPVGTGEVVGYAVTTAADGQPLRVVGVRVALTSTTDSKRRFETTTDETGSYSFQDVPPASFGWSFVESIFEFVVFCKEVVEFFVCLQQLILQILRLPIHARLLEHRYRRVSGRN